LAAATEHGSQVNNFPWEKPLTKSIAKKSRADEVGEWLY